MQPTTTHQHSQQKTTHLQPTKKKASGKSASVMLWDESDKDSLRDTRVWFYVRKEYRKLFKTRSEAQYLISKNVNDFCRSIQIKSKEPKFKRLNAVSKERKGAGRKPVKERVIQTGITIYLSGSDLKRIGGIQLIRAMCRDYIDAIIEGEPYYIPEREYLPRPSKMKPYQITVYLKRSDIESRFNDVLTFKEVLAAWFTSLMQELNINNYSIARFKKEQIIKYL